MGYKWTDKILILPIADLMTYILIGVFVIVLLVIFLISFRHLTKRAVKDTRWNILLSYLLRHDLITKEVDVVSNLYHSLESSVQEELLTSKRRFHHLIYDFILERNDLSVEDRVKIMEKLFPPTEHIGEVKSLADVSIGEICAVESGTDKFICNVVKKTPEEVMLSIENFEPMEMLKGSPAEIYVFRPHVGGFTIPGIINEIAPDFVRFKASGEVEQKSGHHFMAEIVGDVEFIPWPKPPAGDKAAGHIIQGKSKYFSDRSLLFEAKNEEDVPFYLNRHEVWTLQTKLPEGYVFTCRGMIKVSKGYDKSYVFKYLDASETSRNVLYAEIKNHNPVKESIG